VSFSLSQFAGARRYAFHLTDPANLVGIQRERRLISAAEAMTRFDRLDLLTERRRRHERLTKGENKILLRDQGPLHAGHIDFRGDWTLARFVQELNDHVYFWTGNPGISTYGRRHFERYRSEAPVVLRLECAELFNSSPMDELRFCRFNSGSPRTVNGRKSPRGPETFVAGPDFPGAPADVVEVVFRRGVALPPSTEIGPTPDGPWHRLFG
jgi:hypothetical protein